jgi:hypothetical protein
MVARIFRKYNKTHLADCGEPMFVWIIMWKMLIVKLNRDSGSLQGRCDILVSQRSFDEKDR